MDKLFRKIKYILLIIFIVNISFNDLFADKKAKYHVIIDTDCAADDLRATCMLLASSKVEVLAITTSDGALNPQEGLLKVNALLKTFGHEGIPYAAGKTLQNTPPVYRTFAQSINWGDENFININYKMNAEDLITSSIELEEKPITIVVMGPLTNIFNFLQKNQEKQNEIERIIWYNEQIHPAKGTNYKTDKNAADYILNQKIKIDVISIGEVAYSVNEDFLQALGKIKSPYAQKIVCSHKNSEIIQKIKSKHLKFWDDLVPIFLLYPDLFNSKKFNKFPAQSIHSATDYKEIEKKIITILDCDKQDKSIVLKRFPDNPTWIREDVAKHMNQIIEKHGRKEWKIVTLTNEFHEHLGIYSIIGAKMGLRAREYFNVDIDELKIVSYAGNTPPISCLNDGLQVSTGATLGHGTISITNEFSPRPQADFSFKTTTLSLILKDEYWEIIKNDVRQGIEQYGNLTDEYWQFIRELAIQYWLEWDRREIFNLEIN